MDLQLNIPTQTELKAFKQQAEDIRDLKITPRFVSPLATLGKWDGPGSPFSALSPPNTYPSASISRSPLYDDASYTPNNIYIDLPAGYSEVLDQPRIVVDGRVRIPITKPGIGNFAINANDTPFMNVSERCLRVYLAWPGYGARTLYIDLSGRKHKLTCGRFVSEVAAQICKALDEFAGKTQFPYKGPFAKFRLHYKARGGVRNSEVYLRALKPIINDEGWSFWFPEFSVKRLD